jgi:threonine synthase
VALGLTDRVPELVGVQAEGAAPVTAAFEGGCDVVPLRARSCADSIAVGHPRNWRKALKGVKASGGSMMSVTDDEILSAITDLARATGVFGEPAGVAAFAGLTKAVRDGAAGPDETIAVLMTGSGLKDTESAIKAAGEPIPVGLDVADVERFLSRS